MPYISVLMPVFNAQNTLRLSLKSTLAALPRDSELLLIDDGSNDRSVDIAEEVRAHDPRVRILSLGRNAGIVTALNTGLQSTDSGYVARMDADDVCLPWRFRYSVDGQKNCNADVLFATTAAFSTRSVRPGLPIAISPKAMPFHLLMVNPVAHSTMFGKREAIMELGGYREVPSEDYDLWLRLTSAGKRLARLPLPSLLYRTHANQITAQSSWRTEAALNKETAHMHRLLCRQILDIECNVYSDLRSSNASDALSGFLGLIEQKSGHLRPLEKRFIGRQVRITKGLIKRRSVSTGPAPDRADS